MRYNRPSYSGRKAASGEGLAERATPNSELKRDWVLSGSALQRLLEWLDEGSDSGGEKYLEMRRRLVSYFDRKNCLSPDDLADETLNRVARRLEEEGATEGAAPARYCYIVAKFVFLEQLRRIDSKTASLNYLSPADTNRVPALIGRAETANSAAVKERLLDCLEQCVRNLDQDSRELIAQYYHGDQRIKIENRRLIAARLGLTQNAVTIRACRIRDKLETCVRSCAAGG